MGPLAPAATTEGTGAAPALSEAEPAVARRGRERSRVVQTAKSFLSAALVVAIFVLVIPKLADAGRVWQEIRAMARSEAAVLLMLAGWNMVTYWLVWMACLPGLSAPKAAVATEASTAVANTVPGGSYVALAVTYSIFHSWGFRRSIVTLAILVTGVWNNLAKFALPVVALALLAFTGDADAARVAAGVLGLVALGGVIGAFAAALRTPRRAAQIGNIACGAVGWGARLVRRPPPAGWDVAVVRFREKTIDLLSHRWHWISLATLTSHLSLYAVLLVSLRAIGVPEADVSWIEVLAAFSFARLVTAIPITPGGLGIVEVAMATALVAAGGERAGVMAAVLVYRALTYALPLPLGAGCYLVWRSKRSWRREAAT